MTMRPAASFSGTWQDGLFLLNPAWYAGPVGMFLVGISGKASELRSLGPVRSVAVWLSRGTTDHTIPSETLLAALGLLMLPLCIAGVFAVLWRQRHVHARVTIETRRRPAPLTEIGMFAMFCLAFWAIILDSAPSACARCPAAGSTAYYALHAAGLWMLALLPYGIAVTIYTRLVVWFPAKNVDSSGVRR